jgi:hypothetical protein
MPCHNSGKIRKKEAVLKKLQQRQFSLSGIQIRILPGYPGFWYLNFTTAFFCSVDVIRTSNRCVPASTIIREVLGRYGSQVFGHHGQFMFILLFIQVKT